MMSEQKGATEIKPCDFKAEFIIMMSVVLGRRKKK